MSSTSCQNGQSGIPAQNAFDLFEVYDPKSKGLKTEADVIFVHGLAGHPQKTWSAGDVFWIQSLLPKDFPSIRISTFGYSTEFIKISGVTTVTDVSHITVDAHSVKLLDRVNELRKKTGTTEIPLFWASHSLGGLVVANGLSRKHGADIGEQGIVDQTKGVIFLGTPFLGSVKAKWADWIERIVRYVGGDTDRNTISVLAESSVGINLEFCKFREERWKKNIPLQVACFFETYKTTIEKQLFGGYWNQSINLGVIVGEESAAVLGIQSKPIAADHIRICKYASGDDDGYKMFRDALNQMMGSSSDLKPIQKPTFSQGNVSFGTGFMNYGGNVAGNILSTHENGIIQSSTHTFNFGSS